MNKEKKQLTKREKMLLFIMAIMLVGYIGGNFLIKPAFQKMSDLELERDNIQMQADMTRLKIEAIPVSKINGEKLLSEVNNSMSNISTFKNDEDVDKMLTGICKDSGLKPRSLAIKSDPYSKIDFETKFNKLNKPEDEEAVIDEELPVANSENYTRVAHVNMSVSGSFSNLLSFFENINDNPYLAVQSFSSSLRGNTKDNITEFVHTISIKVNMLNI